MAQPYCVSVNWHDKLKWRYYSPGVNRVGGVVVSVLAIGSKGCGFVPGQDDGFLRAIKIRCTPSLGWEVNRRSHVVRFYGI
jgi:hypothetical protein